MCPRRLRQPKCVARSLGAGGAWASGKSPVSGNGKLPNTETMISVFDIFKVGIGPSSSHTVGPMRAARAFLLELEEAGFLRQTARVRCDLFGSLALTGLGHGTDRALLMGLEGALPDRIDPDAVAPAVRRIRREGRIRLLGRREVDFEETSDLVFHPGESLPAHPNGLRFTAEAGLEQRSRDYYSVGGGAILRADEIDGPPRGEEAAPVPYPFRTAAELLEMAEDAGGAIDELVLANEERWRSRAEVRDGLLEIWGVMEACVRRGFAATGILPGGLNVKRRAPDLYLALAAEPRERNVLEWLSAYALAVNEENAAGGRVVTAPTNGAAGIIPSVGHYYLEFCDGAGSEGIIRYLLTAAAIGILYKENASISGAEMGCQGEVGVACSMAAGGLAAALGGSSAQVENAAEIGMEHNLGLTCDPVKGLVQIPCIERNAMASAKAVSAARIALRGDGTHVVSLDQVIATMRQTGRDMQTIYKETSLGGLAVNVTEC